MPGYTHLQRAQPVYLSHHLLAYFWMLGRDAKRFAFVREATEELPLGAGALAGVNFATDRGLLAQQLGFARVAPNSIDAVSNRDFVLDYLGAAAICATHLSRLGAELVLWSSDEFGFAEVADAWASGSSIMPQKKNPDAAELLRAKAPRIVAHLTGLHGVMHGLPLTYNKDLQEDKEHLFDAVDTLELSLAAATGMLGGIAFDRERLAAAAADELIAATDVADLLVRRGVPFRQSHGIVAGLVRETLAAGQVALRALAGGARGATRPSSTTSSTRCSPSAPGSSPRSPRAAPRCRACASSCERARAEPRVNRAFYERGVVEVARDLVGCVLRHGETRRRDRRDRGLPRVRARLPRARRADRRARTSCSARPARAYVYRSYGIHALFNAVCRGRGRRRRGADPRAGAARGARADARAARPRSGARTSAPARAS